SPGERDGLGGDGLLVGEAKPGDALDRIAERDMDASPRLTRRGVEPVPDPQWQPGPGAGLVAGQENRVAAAGQLRGDMADRTLKPGDSVTAARRVVRPARHADVV